MYGNEILSRDVKMFIVEENERGASLKDVGDCFWVSPFVVWRINAKLETSGTKHKQEDRVWPLKSQTSRGTGSSTLQV